MIGAITAGLLAGGVAASTNAYESIATVNVGAGGVSRITFSSIPATYKHLQVRALLRGDSANASTNVMYNINGDGTTADYTYHILRGDGSSASAAGGTGLNLLANDIAPAATNTANTFGAFVCDILDYSSSSKNKTVRTLGGRDGNGNGFLSLNSTLWISTSAITQFEIYLPSGNIVQNSSFALYGIKG